MWAPLEDPPFSTLRVPWRAMDPTALRGGGIATAFECQTRPLSRVAPAIRPKQSTVERYTTWLLR